MCYFQMVQAGNQQGLSYTFYTSPLQGIHLLWTPLSRELCVKLILDMHHKVYLASIAAASLYV